MRTHAAKMSARIPSMSPDRLHAAPRVPVFMVGPNWLSRSRVACWPAVSSRYTALGLSAVWPGQFMAHDAASRAPPESPLAETRDKWP